MKFKNKIAVITGGARGIGRAIAFELNREGATTIVTYNTSVQSAKSLENELPNMANLSLYKLNLLNEKETDAFAKEILGKFGKVDYLINNASYSDSTLFLKCPYEYTKEDFLKPFEVDVYGGIVLVQRFVKSMIEQRFGRIIFFSSASALKGDFLISLAAAKTAIVGVVKSFARMFSEYGITVNAIAPGAIDTGWIQKWNVPKDWVDKLIASTPLKRLGKPEEIAQVVSFLLCEDSSYITGQIITVDGGAYL
jgi:3-oxoacyl-[acyl-carrier protein] reductase